MLNVEMLSTGDEVLYGQIVDTNASWLADFLFEQGFPMTRRQTVGDKFADLVAILQARSHEADILIVNGGLGPTSDDLSAEAAAKAAGTELVIHEEWLAHMTRFFAERGRPMAPSNRKQAMIPAGSEMIDNPVGTACGFAMQLNRCLFFFTPGVPSEFKQMVEQEILPRLRKRYPSIEMPLCLRMTTFGRSESDLAQQLDPLPLPEGVVLGYRSSMPIIELKLTGPSAQRTGMQQAWQKIRDVVGESLIFEGTEGLLAQLAMRLQEQHLTLALSEQFTAGMLCWQLTNAGVAVVQGQVLPSSAPESLAGCVQRARQLAEQQGSSLALVTGAIDADNMQNLALHTPDKTVGLRVNWSGRRHSVETRQAVCAMLAMNMLRRWLNGWDVSAEHGWIHIEEQLTHPA